MNDSVGQWVKSQSSGARLPGSELESWFLSFTRASYFQCLWSLSNGDEDTSDSLYRVVVRIK